MSKTLLSKVLAAVAAAAMAIVGALTAARPVQTDEVEVWPPQPICSVRPSTWTPPSTVQPTEPTVTALPSPINSTRPRPSVTPTPAETC